MTFNLKWAIRAFLVLLYKIIACILCKWKMVRVIYGGRDIINYLVSWYLTFLTFFNKDYWIFVSSLPRHAVFIDPDKRKILTIF